MRIIMLETVSNGREVYRKSEKVDVSDNLGIMFCEAGIARDMSGNVVTRPITPHVELSIGNAVQQVGGKFNG